MAALKKYIEQDKEKVLTQARVDKSTVEKAKKMARKLNIFYNEFLEAALKKAIEESK